MKTLCIAILSVLWNLCISQSHEQFSNLYTKKGKLISDNAFQLNIKQMKRWHVIEDSVLTNIQNSLQYPLIYRESYVMGKLIYSFTVDKNGNVTELRVEKQSLNGQPWYGRDTSTFAPNYFTTEISKILSKQSRLLKRLSDPSKSISRFYLPFDFVLFYLEDQDAPVTGIYEGWLRHAATVPPLTPESQF